MITCDAVVEILEVSGGGETPQQRVAQRIQAAPFVQVSGNHFHVSGSTLRRSFLYFQKKEKKKNNKKGRIEKREDDDDQMRDNIGARQKRHNNTRGLGS